MRNGHKNVKIVQCLNPRFVWKAKCRNLFLIVCLTCQMSCQPAMGVISSTVIIEYSGTRIPKLAGYSRYLTGQSERVDMGVGESHHIRRSLCQVQSLTPAAMMASDWLPNYCSICPPSLFPSVRPFIHHITQPPSPHDDYASLSRHRCTIGHL